MYSVLFLFGGELQLAACGVLVPQPGIEPVPAAVEAQSPNPGPPGIPRLIYSES